MDSLYHSKKVLNARLKNYFDENPNSYETIISPNFNSILFFIDNYSQKDNKEREFITFHGNNENPTAESMVEDREKYVEKFGDDGSLLFQLMRMESQGRSEEINTELSEMIGRFDMLVEKSNRIINNHEAINWESLRKGLQMNGMRGSDADSYRETLLKMASHAILDSTPSDGEPALASAQHVANSLLSTLGQVKAIREFPDMEVEIKEINRKMTPEYQTSLSM